MSELKTNEQPTKRRNSLWYIIGASILLVIGYQSGASTRSTSPSETSTPPSAATQSTLASAPAAQPEPPRTRGFTGTHPNTPPEYRIDNRESITMRERLARERFERERLEREQPATQNAGTNITPLIPVEQRTQQRVARPMIASDNMPEIILPPANFPAASTPGQTTPVVTTPVIPGPPPGLLPSAIVAADPAQTPHPAPANSIYDRRTPGAITQASHNAAHQPSPGSIRPSETGLLPLVPLAPLAPLPAGQSGAIPAVLRQPPSPGAVSIRPAVLCNCGKEH